MKDVRPNLLPKARTDRLVIKELPDETLVYDLNTDEAYCLNLTARNVWKECNGQNSLSEITASMSHLRDHETAEGVVWLALEQLEKCKLLDETQMPAAVIGGVDRRNLIRTLGIAAVALPAIASIVVPTAQAQASPCALAVGRPTGCACTTGTQCLSTCCKNGTNVCEATVGPQCH